MSVYVHVKVKTPRHIMLCTSFCSSAGLCSVVICFRNMQTSIVDRATLASLHQQY